MKVHLCAKCLHKPEEIPRVCDANATELCSAECPKKSVGIAVHSQGYADVEYRENCQMWHRAWRKRRAAEMTSWAARAVL
jgi:hypothetical protein